MSPSARRTDLDLVRIVICALVIVAHALLIFAAEPRYHLKSALAWPLASVAYEFLRIATMAVFFALAGWSAVVSLRRRSAARFLAERVERLLLPLVAGTVTLGPVIKFIELHNGRDLRLTGVHAIAPSTEPFAEVAVHFFGRLNVVTWSHLWFLAYLLVISAATLPALRWLAGRPREALPASAWLVLPALPLAGVLVALGGYWPFLPGLFNDPANLVYFALCFLAGGAMAAWPAIEAMLRARAVWLLAMMAGGFAGVLWFGEGDPGRVMVALTAWGAIGGVLGLAGRHPPRRSTVFDYLNEATLPVYILHHVPVLALGAWTLQQGWPPAVQVAVIVGGATTITLAAYHWLVRPWPLMRWLLGMGPLAASRETTAPARESPQGARGA